MELPVNQLTGFYKKNYIVHTLLRIYIVSVHLIIYVYLSNSNWKNSANCSLDQIYLLDEVMDCRGNVSFKCLRVWVNISSPEKTLRLYYDEEAVKSRPKVQQSVLFNWVEDLIILSFQILYYFHSSGFMDYDFSAKLQRESTIKVQADKFFKNYYLLKNLLCCTSQISFAITVCILKWWHTRTNWDSVSSQICATKKEIWQ